MQSGYNDPHLWRRCDIPIMFWLMLIHPVVTIYMAGKPGCNNDFVLANWTQVQSLMLENHPNTNEVTTKWLWKNNNFIIPCVSALPWWWNTPPNMNASVPPTKRDGNTQLGKTCLYLSLGRVWGRSPKRTWNGISFLFFNLETENHWLYNSGFWACFMVWSICAS